MGSSNKRLPPSGPASTTTNIAAMQNLSIRDKSPVSDVTRPLVPRPAYGKAGRQVTVLTNHFIFRMTNNAAENIHKYRAVLTTKSQMRITGRTTRRVFELLLDRSSDGQHMYTDYKEIIISTTPLSNTSYDVDYFEQEEQGPRSPPNQVHVNVTITADGDPLPFRNIANAILHNTPPLHRSEDCVSALNIMLLKKAGQDRHVQTSGRGTRSFAWGIAANTFDLTRGLSGVRGYERAVRATTEGLKLLCNTTCGAFYKPGRLDMQMDILEPERYVNIPDRRRTMCGHLKGLRVRTQYGDRKVKTIRDIPRVPMHPNLAPTATAITFSNNGTVVSVATHFAQAYPNVQRPNPNAWVVDVGSDTFGSIYIPADLCTILDGQLYKRQLHADQTTNMIRHACKKPQENIGFITSDGIQQLGFHPNRILEGQSGLGIGNQLISVQARSIGAPEISFKNAKLRSSDTGSGKWNMAGRKFAVAGKLLRWTWIEFRGSNQKGRCRNVKDFEAGVRAGLIDYCGFNPQEAQCLHVGCNCTNPNGMPHSHLWPAVPTQLLTNIFKHLGECGVRYVFVISSDKKWYPHIKRVADTIGMHTSVTLRRKDEVKVKASEIANLLLKYNLKTGGSNWTLDTSQHREVLANKSTMFIGADVVHPPPGAMKKAPSVVGVVATMAKDNLQYYPGVLALQHPEEGKKAKETITILDVLVKDRLDLFRKTNGHLPDQICMFRDGVSDSQLQTCMDVEYELMQKACKAVYGSNNVPPILFAVVQKRHAVRFYRPPNDKTSFFDNNGNPLPGLIVDRDVVSPTCFDWFGTSHKCIQGTSRPAKHVVLHNGLQAATDVLQRLFNDLGFAFGRATTPISVPTPARLADLLCQRARYHLHPVYFPDNSEEVYDPNANHFKGQADIHHLLRDTMYYI